MNRIEFNEGQDFLIWGKGSGGNVEILDIAVNSERGVGIGTRLVNTLIEQVRSDTRLIFAVTRLSNYRAHSFYRKFGFAKIGTLLHFYVPEMEDAVVFGFRVK